MPGKHDVGGGQAGDLTKTLIGSVRADVLLDVLGGAVREQKSLSGKQKPLRPGEVFEVLAAFP